MRTKSRWTIQSDAPEMKISNGTTCWANPLRFGGTCALLLQMGAAGAVWGSDLGGFEPPSAPQSRVTNPSRVVPSLRNMPSHPTRVETRNQPSHPVNRQLRLSAPELATPTPGVPPLPAAGQPAAPAPNPVFRH